MCPRCWPASPTMNRKVNECKVRRLKKTTKHGQKKKKKAIGVSGESPPEKCRMCGFETDDVAARLICVRAKRG